MGRGAPPPRRVVIVTPVLPYDTIPHAGGVYLQRLQHALVQSGSDLTFVSAASERGTLLEAGCPPDPILLGEASPRTLPRRAAMRVASIADGRLRSHDPTWPPLPFLLHLMASREARRALRAADVIDLQWPEYSRLAPFVRRLNAHARVIGTFHDVLSQRWDRRRMEAAPSATAQLRRAAISSRKMERTALRHLDVAVVFSEKDRDLLPSSAGERASIKVVAPPLATRAATPRRPTPDAPVVVFVGQLGRIENDDAVRWLLRDIWPKVVTRVPSAQLHLVGSGASDLLRDSCAHRADVQLTGYVEDLSSVYARASACVVPLRSGAGVKFKTIEALVAGVPVVTTSVGAEGIGGPDLLPRIIDDAPGLAESLVDILQNPAQAEAEALRAQGWARRRYDVDRFREAVSRIYLKGL